MPGHREAGRHPRFINIDPRLLARVETQRHDDTVLCVQPTSAITGMCVPGVLVNHVVGMWLQ
jgi:hypothetical protein